MQQVAVRRASAHDRGEWLRMRRLLWPEVDLEDHEREVDVQLDQESDEGAVFLVDDGTTVVGFLEVSRAPEAPGCSTCPVALLEAWYVDDDARGLGFGASLVRAAETWARAQGLYEMASDARADNRTSRAAHRALGFEETDEAVHFRKSL